MLGLRTVQGVDLARYEQEFGPDVLHRLERNATPLRQAGLLEEAGGRIRLSESGILLANEVLARLSW
jgi:coproporphyrinogen III oxidase-like Fe-S oxidoreductase